MSMRTLLLCSSLALTLAACGSDGTLGGPCLTDEDCDPGLTCNEAQLCVEPVVPAGIYLDVTPAETYLQAGAELALKARVFEPGGLLLFNRAGAPVIVDWASSDDGIVTVDRFGVVRALRVAPVTITASVRGSDARFEVTINPGTENVLKTLPPPAFTDMHMIYVDPPRVALDVGNSRTFNVTAVDTQGSPTTLDCASGFDLEFDRTFFSASFARSENFVDLDFSHLDVSGRQKGFSLLTLNCAGFFASPVIVEVKPSVTIPDPSQTGASNFGLDLHFALDGNEIHMVSMGDSKLVYTHFQGIWTSEVLDGEGRYGYTPRVVLDPLNESRPLVCAGENVAAVAPASSRLTCWSKNSAGFWIKRTVEEGPGYNAGTLPYSFDMVAQPDGTIAMLYPRGGSLWLARSTLASRDDWSVERLVSSDNFSALALASDGTLRVAYQQAGKLYYAHSSEAGGGAWHREIIDGAAASPAPETYIRLALGESNQPQVVYYKNGNLVHAQRSGGAWGIGVIETVKVAGHRFGFALDRHQRPRVSYYDTDANAMRHAYHTGRKWQIETPLADHSQGSFSYLVVDDYGRAQIAYHDGRSGKAGYYVEPHFLDYSDVDSAAAEPLANTWVTSCAGACHPAALCTAENGGMTCGACAPPFVGSGACECGPGFASGEGFECEACPETYVGDGVTCTCPPGTGESGGRCVEVDGCADEPCYPGVACTDVPAPGEGFECAACPTGHLGDGRVCSYATEITAGGNHTCAVLSSGEVRCWGGPSGLGTGSTTSSSTPVVVSGISMATAVSTAYSHTCALLGTGQVHCWGNNGSGQLGDGSTTLRRTPVAVNGLTGAISITTGLYHSCALLGTGEVRCWGGNGFGQLGDGTDTQRGAPVAVSGLSGATAIAAGREHTCALLGTGEVRCWGAGHWGQLGDGTTTRRYTPVEVSNLGSTTGISAGEDHTCAVLATGQVRCWGGAVWGQLGDGTSTDTGASPLPVTVSDLAGATAVAAGAYYTCALLGTGEARCWGHNEYGKLGDGTNTDRLRPVAVTGLLGATAITAGRHTCALLETGETRCWGKNWDGQLGDGTYNNSPTPVPVVW